MPVWMSCFFGTRRSTIYYCLCGCRMSSCRRWCARAEDEKEKMRKKVWVVGSSRDSESPVCVMLGRTFSLPQSTTVHLLLCRQLLMSVLCTVRFPVLPSANSSTDERTSSTATRSVPDASSSSSQIFYRSSWSVEPQPINTYIHCVKKRLFKRCNSVNNKEERSNIHRPSLKRKGEQRQHQGKTSAEVSKGSSALFYK